MENQDKIYSQFKNAAQNSAEIEVPNNDKIWNRIEEKMDKKVLKKQNKLWKKIAVAASILLVVSVGYQFFKTDKIETVNQDSIVVEDSVSVKNSDVVAKTPSTILDTSKLVSAKQAITIIKKQTQSSLAVAVQETKKISATNSYEYNNDIQPSTWTSQPETSATEKEKDSNFERRKFDAISVKKISEEIVTPTEYKKKQEEVISKNVPLLIINNKAIVTKNAANYDKLTKDEFAKLNNDDIETLLYLKEPLYVIDGKQYSEEELFGKKPTSPYAPLSEQEIINTKVLQGEQAIAAYGEKGEKGVLIITTKNGRPVKKAGKKIK